MVFLYQNWLHLHCRKYLTARTSASRTANSDVVIVCRTSWLFSEVTLPSAHSPRSVHVAICMSPCPVPADNSFSLYTVVGADTKLDFETEKLPELQASELAFANVGAEMKDAAVRTPNGRHLDVSRLHELALEPFNAHSECIAIKLIGRLVSTLMGGRAVCGSLPLYWLQWNQSCLADRVKLAQLSNDIRDVSNKLAAANSSQTALNSQLSGLSRDASTAQSNLESIRQTDMEKYENAVAKFHGK